MHDFSTDDLEDIQDSETETVSVRKAGDTLPAQITSYPDPSEPATVRGVIISSESDQSPKQPVSLGDYVRRMKAEKTTQHIQ